MVVLVLVLAVVKLRGGVVVVLEMCGHLSSPIHCCQATLVLLAALASSIKQLAVVASLQDCCGRLAQSSGWLLLPSVVVVVVVAVLMGL